MALCLRVAAIVSAIQRRFAPLKMPKILFGPQDQPWAKWIVGMMPTTVGIC